MRWALPQSWAAFAALPLEHQPLRDGGELLVSSLPMPMVGDPKLKPRGSLLARGLLRLFGWRVCFDGYCAPQGVVLVYPHTSNWDFVLGVLGKWALGLQLHFWGKDSLFRIPVFKHWIRWIGGIPVDRTHRHGMVGSMVEQMKAAQARGDVFWLAAAPEGTRSLATGWRSGAYQVAVQARVPIGLAYFDFASRTVSVTHFVQPSGDPALDLPFFAQTFAAVKGKRPELASPIQFKK